MNDSLQIEIRDSLADVPAAQWNALCDDGNPFVTHEFLYSLEATGCLGEHNGWFPRYVLLWSGDPGGDLVAAVPAYLKTNSYGEFVFDWAWAEAFERHGLEYYPKMVASIPFTPATGRRLLVRSDQPYAATVNILASSMMHFCKTQKYSGLHWLFITEAESVLLCGDDYRNATPTDTDTDTDTDSDGDDDGDGVQHYRRNQKRIDEKKHEPDSNTTELADAFLRRVDCQYHWHNRQYTDFEHFLSLCTSRRRKTIRRERRHVSDAELKVEQRLGSTLTELEWQQVHDLYSSTFDRKWGSPWLTLDFFRRMGSIFGDKTLIVFAYNPHNSVPDTPIGCAVMFIGADTLYGRYWGCSEQHNSLHFEACYYQGIDYCIEHGIDNFEPGAQGEHKITRGFEPTITTSAHFIAHPGFRDAITDYLHQEAQHVHQRCAGLANLLPFKAAPIKPTTDD